MSDCEIDEQIFNAKKDGNIITSINQQPFKVMEFMPHKLALWFRMLEIQFKKAWILKEESKFTTALAHIPGKYIEQIEDEGRYYDDEVNINFWMKK